MQAVEATAEARDDSSAGGAAEPEEARTISTSEAVNLVAELAAAVESNQAKISNNEAKIMELREALA